MTDFKALQTTLIDQTKAFSDATLKLNQEVIELSQLKKRSRKIANKLCDNLKREIKRFHQKVEHPEIIFATTGTTSSGKSTLVNLLCGAFIMPEAVGEMSAGVVEIKHGEATKVEVLPTKGASWFIGTKTGLSDADLQALLTEVMHAYNDHREAEHVPECPRIKVTYPTRLGLELARFGFPPEVKFSLTILDLPGLKYVGDTQNAAVIDEYSARAMSFVTYNAAETDPLKQEALLRQVVDQVKTIGGSPARMMFILNRIDEYEKDPDPTKSKEKVFNTLTEKLRATLLQSLPQHSSFIQEITPHPLSTKPALLAHLGEYRDLEKYFKYLMDDELLDDLPRKVEKWSEDDKELVSLMVKERAHFDQFEEALKDHLQGNLPEIIFPLPLRELKEDGLRPSLHNSAQLIDATLSSLEKSYDEKIKEIDVVKKTLKVIDQDHREKIEYILFNRSKSVVMRFSEAYDIDPEKESNIHVDSIYYALMIIQTTVGSLIDRLFAGILEYFLDGKDFDYNILEGLEAEIVFNFALKMANLKAAGYKCKLAEEGYSEYEEKSSQGDLEKLGKALSDFAQILSKIIPGLIDYRLQFESKIISEGITGTLNFMLDKLFQDREAVSKDIIAVPSRKITKVQHTFETIQSGLFNIQSSLGISSESRKEIIGTRTVKKKERFLILFTREVEHRVPVYEDIEYSQAKIPSLYELLDSFTLQLKDEVTKLNERLLKEIEKTFMEAFEIFLKEQKDSMDEFVELLREQHEQREQGYTQERESWEKLKKRRETLSQNIEAFTLESILQSNQ